MGTQPPEEPKQRPSSQPTQPESASGQPNTRVLLIGIGVLIALAVIAGALFATGVFGGNHPDTPVNAFYADAKAGNCDGMLDQLTGVAKSTMEKLPSGKEFFCRAGKNEAAEVELVGTKVSNETDTTADVAATVKNKATESTVNYKVRKTDDGWKISGFGGVGLGAGG